MTSSTKQAKTLIDLFCGCGGASIGFRNAGFQIKLGVDNDQRALRSFHEYFGVPTMAIDIMKADYDEILRKAGFRSRRPDVVIGCPPCQGFSRLSNVGEGDPRNALVERFAVIVEGLEPKFIAFENVPGLDGKSHFLNMTRSLEDLGYELFIRDVKMEEYGVPQRRRRLVCVGARRGEYAERYSFPEPDHGVVEGQEIAKASVRDAFVGLPALRIGESSIVPDHSAPMHGELMMRKIGAVPWDGGSRRDLPEELQYRCHAENSNAGFKDVMGRMHWNIPSPTITTGCYSPSKGRYIHPDQDRAITVREAARLQTFPDDFIFPQDKTSATRMIGNALPPLFAEKLGSSIMKALRS